MPEAHGAPREWGSGSVLPSAGHPHAAEREAAPAVGPGAAAPRRGRSSNGLALTGAGVGRLSSRLPDPLGRQSVRPGPLPEFIAGPWETRGSGFEGRAPRPLPGCPRPVSPYSPPKRSLPITGVPVVGCAGSDLLAASHGALARGPLARNLFGAAPRQRRKGD